MFHALFSPLKLNLRKILDFQQFTTIRSLCYSSIILNNTFIEKKIDLKFKKINSMCDNISLILGRSNHQEE